MKGRLKYLIKTTLVSGKRKPPPPLLPRLDIRSLTPRRIRDDRLVVATLKLGTKGILDSFNECRRIDDKGIDVSPVIVLNKVSPI